MPYQVRFKPAAERAIRKMEKSARRRIFERAEALADDPRPKEAKKLRGADDLWRIRVGELRIIYAIEDEILLVLVVKAGHRRDIYRDV